MADAANWQRELLVGERLQSQLSYWKQQLAGCNPLAMPTDRPRPAAFSYRGRTMAFQVDAKLAAAVKDLAQQQGATVFMALLAAFQVLLARYSGQSDVCVGSPIANRTRTELEGLIGFFTNTLVLRINLEDGPSFRRLLDRVKQLCLDAYANQDVPFERLVEELKVERDPSRNPLFQVMFALQNAPSQQATLPGLTLEPMTVPSDIAKFDLMMTLVEQADGSLSGDLEYATDLFEQATMQRLAGHYLRLLAAAVDGAHLRIGELPLLTETEQQQLVVTWNQTSTDLPAQCVHQLFEAQAESSPDGVAVSYGDKQLSYRQLNQRANQLAHHLRSLGVGPDKLVGLCAERSLDMVVAMVAILKAGGAYVPLDPSYPAERLAFMLQDVEPVAVVAQSALLHQLPALHCPCVLLDEPERLSGFAQDNPVNVSLPHHLAYVIYTSGSTGQPRGVCVDHRAIVRLVKHTDYAQLGKTDCVAQASTSSFDAATFEIWGALLHGCRLVGIPKEVALSPRDLAECLRQRGITTLFLTTALFNQIVRTMPTAFATLRQLLFGGEAVDPVAVRRVLAEGPPALASCLRSDRNHYFRQLVFDSRRRG